ncbi:PREDICTED: NADPH:adrenodoxin oxidoreductase, mitochondrial isoform X2 [Vollenhovia emeryi]|uniref:NADPH:adrenodoxin oxidoreductase, mitochondrial isoform X2 n=1 Tax=Vollenhovia emeryi TaxID=411798 RepID=UPI0005F46CFC|nr:PREDICTED: NADPH:adrenodoxin oxidoreductase, mitochondrial isoform X2 [Vollenhovia emeryi]
MRFNVLKSSTRSLCTVQRTPQVCIVGAGPAGFYATQRLLKDSSTVRIDILDKLPIPFGLIRYGVAPDHPEVKNVLNKFHKVATSPRVQFIGNVKVGTDVSIKDLRDNYDAVLLAYGAQFDRLLNIPGESLNNVISARNFVGWYNGVPEDKNLKINLDIEEAVVIGQGNVAIDVARILLTPIDKLKRTDITSYALEALCHSKVRKVFMVGRRGPLQAAFTTAELREILKLESCKTSWRKQDFENIQTVAPTLDRPRKRQLELMLKSLGELNSDSMHAKELHPIFLRSPVEFQGDSELESIKFAINHLRGETIQNQVAEMTGEFEVIPCGLGLRSIGYKAVQIDDSVPFNFEKGCVENINGKVEGNLYVAGWAATGPTGVLLTTMANAFQVARLIQNDLMSSNTTEMSLGWAGLSDILKMKGIQTVSYEDWQRIDLIEQERGRQREKVREKIVDVEEMLEIAS